VTWVVGDSIVYWANCWWQQHGRPGNLPDVRFLGFRGANIQRLKGLLLEAWKHHWPKPQVVVVHVGTNDLGRGLQGN
jgi:hypothetical protein